MKKINKILFFLYGVIVILIIALTVLIWNRKKTIQNSMVNEISSTILNKANFIVQPYRFQKKRLLLALSPDCDYCIEILQYIEVNKKAILEKYQVIIALNDSVTKIQQFCEQHKTIIDTGIEIYNDKQRRLLNYLQIKSYPSIFVLNNNNIIEEGNGLENIKTIIERLN